MSLILLFGAVVFGAIGTLAIFSSGSPDVPWWMSWVSWFVFTPAFICLFYVFEDFGVFGAFALWGAAVGLIVTIQGARWGDRLSKLQVGSIVLVLVGLLMIGLGG